MLMKPFVRKLTLIAHIIFSVGWLGAVLPYLVLAVVGLATHDARTARAAYFSMDLIGWFAIVPLSLAALATGIIQSLGTRWGLLRHWWIVAKLALTTVACAILLAHMRAVSHMARIAQETALANADFRAQRIQLVVHAVGGLSVLLAVTVISVFKPWGLTAHGRRSSVATESSRAENEIVLMPDLVVASPRASRWGRIVGFHALGLLLLAVVLHLVGGGLQHH